MNHFFNEFNLPIDWTLSLNAFLITFYEIDNVDLFHDFQLDSANYFIKEHYMSYGTPFKK